MLLPIINFRILRLRIIPPTFAVKVFHFITELWNPFNQNSVQRVHMVKALNGGHVGLG